MSELSSLFVRVKIKKNKFDEFLQSTPNQPLLDENWTEWWNTRKMYGKIELTQAEMYGLDEPTNQSIIGSWKREQQSGTFSNYNTENEIWHFGIIFFAENYMEMIPGLAFIKSIAEYIEDDTENFAIVFDYFWGGNCVNAYISFKDYYGYLDHKVENQSDVNSENLKYVKTYLDKKAQEFSEAQGD